MKITVAAQVHAPLANDAWDLYHAAFIHLSAFAVQRHLMYRKEFDEVMDDRRVRKYLCRTDGALVGLATYTNHLDAMPLISPDYFERRWPDHFRQQRIWWCGFVAVHPGHRRTAAFSGLVQAMWRVATSTGGIIGLDICAENRRLADVVDIRLERLAGHPVDKSCDTQTYHLYEVPAAGL